jgi:hypothetical protein
MPGPTLTLGFDAQVTVDGKVVDGVFIIAPEKKIFGGHLTAEGKGGISLTDLVRSVAPALPEIPLTIEIRDVLFVCEQQEEGNKYLFGIEAGAKIDLADLPLAGPMIRKALPAGQAVSIDDIQLLVASAEFKREEVLSVKKTLPRDSTLPAPLPKGLNLSALARLGGEPIKLTLPIAMGDGAESSKPAAPARSTGSKDPAPSKTSQPAKSDPTKWIQLHKTLGPVLLERIGVRYQEGTIWCMLDASLTLAGMTFSVQGLGAGLKLAERKPLFHLDGMGLAFANGPLEISGGLLKVSDSPLQLDGALLIRAEGLTISAIGSYADLNGTPSLFAFAALHKELGGPAFFFVTGLAFGFGVNRALKLPTINEVQNFPLIKAATDPSYLGKNLDLRDISQKLNEYISPLPGNFWIAAGVKFTSFGQIDSFALLSVSFGTQFQVALLGLSKIQMPKPPAPVIAYAELAIKAVFTPESGLLSFEARLTENSYVLRKDFKLRGGFAFYSWFAGEHEGDFAVSLGGYHPRFLVPAHYPRPDLVEFYCKTGDLTIQGRCYFALCPAAVMAGGGLSMVYQSGGIKAWFIAYADFLVQWKPLHYDIAIGISVGVALSLTIGIIRINMSVELSASVNLYGPPLGGEARISLYIITFTVRFGEDRQLPPPLTWESSDSEKSFAKSFLLNPDVNRVLIADGLLQEVQHDQETTRFVNPHRLVLSCRTQVPVTVARWNGGNAAERSGLKINGADAGKLAAPPWNTRLGVRPMAKSQMVSQLDVSLEPNVSASQDDKTKMQRYLDQYIELSLTTKNVPRALWATDGLNTASPPQEQMIANALVGLEIKTKAGPRPWETPALSLKVLRYDRYRKICNYAEVEPTVALPGSSAAKTIPQTILENTVATRRSQIVAFLADTGRRIMKAENIHLEQLAKNAPYMFQAMPARARVGQNPPRGYLDT